MTRSCAKALALVNWKGVFYQRYALDRHVTALEGGNGAGKTTVMIAAYVVLLPDMSRLRFTNLGETGATGGDKGIWGRLGEAGRPSYAVIDFAIGNDQRLIAGVQLERKSEPTIEPTPFIIWGLAPEIRLQDLLLIAQGEGEAVPELPELKANAARLGGRLQSYGTARDYFAALFDQGVTPLRLSGDEERNKFNEMLRTSMTGGISRVLTSELRSFLLKEESGLSDTLQRMRLNLDACRRTRLEVQEARRLEQEISGIFTAGHGMFAAGLLGARARAEELASRLAAATTAEAEAAQACQQAEAQLTTSTKILERLMAQKEQLTQASHSARERHSRIKAALQAQHQLVQARHDRQLAETAARSAAEARTQAETERQQRRGERQRAQAGYRQAASGLADLQRGLDELHRRAHGYQQATRRLAEVQEALGLAQLAPGEIAAHLAASRAELTTVDQQRRMIRTRLADAVDHRDRHQQIMTALTRLTGQPVSVSAASETALAVLRHHRQQAALADQLPSLISEQTETRRTLGRQQQAQEQARQLALNINGEPAATVVQQAVATTATAQQQHLSAEQAARRAQAAAQQQSASLRQRLDQLTAQHPAWQLQAERAARLATALEQPISDRVSLDQARQHLADRHSAAVQNEQAIRQRQEQLYHEARELLAAGGPFSPALLALKDRLGADLLAGTFEQVAVEQAAILEAQLGPLVQALVVDDLDQAAQSLGERPDSLPEVLLVDRQADITALTAVTGTVTSDPHDLTVRNGSVLRVARIPSRPRLGRRARENRAADLQAEADAQTPVLDTARQERRQLERLIADGDGLLAGLDLWLAGDPAPEIARLTAQLGPLQQEVEQQAALAAAEQAASAALRPRLTALQDLLAAAWLLDLPDQTARLAALDTRIANAQAAEQEVSAGAADLARLDQGLNLLRQPPLSDQEITTLRDQAEGLEQQRQRLDTAMEALDHLSRHSEALEWHEAPKRLAAEQQLVPALKAQLEEAEREQQQADQRTAAAEQAYDQANDRFHSTQAQYQAASTAEAKAARQFEDLGLPEPTAEQLEQAGALVARLDDDGRRLDQQQQDLNRQLGEQQASLRTAQATLIAAEERRASEEQVATPAMAAWNRLRERASTLGLAGDLLTRPPEALAGITNPQGLFQEARSCFQVLRERLRGARGGDSLLNDKPLPRDNHDSGFAEAILDLWLTLRDWLHRRLPAQVAEVDDPREALIRLSDQLSDLEQRLARQENVLRGASEDVARGIDVQIRKARGQVNRLNRHLTGVSFGSIEAIQVRLCPVDHMEKVLQALRSGAAQELLFKPDLPIEDALDEILRQYGGGRTGGQRLLDYREYLRLEVEIRRRSTTSWEVANPTRLSTGEAIGVGAALMMVVLTEWEQDSTLLRGQRNQGSLRFLFLDEANRLSADNLRVLFDLCQSLDLQLLIAAPEVAHIDGNTTYRLIRRDLGHGREEVVAIGRRPV